MIVLTAPTSRIGSQVLRSVIDKGPVRVVARDPGRLDGAVRERVEVVAGSHRDPAVVERAFSGADAVFWLVPADPRATGVMSAYLDFSRPACAVFARGDVGRVVGVSALGRGTPMAGRAGHVTASLAMDDLIAATGVPYRALALPSFMDNVARQAAAIARDGVFTGPIDGDLKAPTCATRDIAAAAVRLLLDDTWTGAGSVAVLGPEDLSCHDMAVVMSDVLGRPVRYQQVPADAFKARMTGLGTSEPMAQAYLDMATAKNEGLDNDEPRTPDSSSPTSFREWCEQVLKPAVGG